MISSVAFYGIATSNHHSILIRQADNHHRSQMSPLYWAPFLDIRFGIWLGSKDVITNLLFTFLCKEKLYRWRKN
jgi:hypothetical protein